MCITCGCDKPNNHQGKEGSLVLKDLKAAADAAGITVVQAARNISSAAAAVEREEKGQARAEGRKGKAAEPSGPIPPGTHPLLHGTAGDRGSEPGVLLSHSDGGAIGDAPTYAGQEGSEDEAQPGLPGSGGQASTPASPVVSPASSPAEKE